MNKRIGLLALILLAIPACQKQKTTEMITTTTCTPRSERTVDTVTKPEVKPVFDEDVEGFVLDEPGNAFGAPTEETEEEDINIVERDVVDDAWIDKRLEAAQEYGFKSIYFNFGEHGIRPDQKSVLDYDLKKVADLTQKGSTVVVEGHACRFAGSETYNMMLSTDRAQAIADYFITKGVPREKMKVVGRGFDMCIVPEGDVDQQAPNRRVEFYVLDEKTPA